MSIPLHAPLLLLAACLAAIPARAAPAAPAMPPAGIHLEGKRIVWQGEMTPAHAEEFARLAKRGEVDGLELRNSPGAGKFAITVFGSTYRILRDRKLPTYVRGLCASVCASVFLAGKSPTMLPSLTPGVPTVLMFHAVRYKGTVDAALTRTLVADIATVRGEPARHLLLKVADETLPRAALYVFPRPVDADAGRSAVLFCSGQPGQGIRHCAPVPGDALDTLGVVNGL